ncbi:MAG: SRPBCC domain-containing protein [Alphaproteobacteria bacterium]|nr:SRPBCC domain-containing protein [Alphaproteobacteria bacterium]
MFTRTIDTTIAVAATPARVWDVLTDFAAYPDWNPFIRRIEGVARPGIRLTVEIAPPGRRAMTFRPRVLSAVPERELRWLGELVVPWLFDGAHGFAIVPAEGGCVFRQSEVFVGLLVPAMGRASYAAVRAGFAAMNAALKARAEA